MHNQEPYSANQWLKKIQLANNLFSTGKIEQSKGLYLAALSIAQQSFDQYKHADPLPAGLTPALVVSYLDLAELWAAKKNKALQLECLLEIYEFLKRALNDLAISDALRNQLFTAYGKVFLELQYCLRKLEQPELLGKIEQDYGRHPVAYQTYSSAVH